MRTRTDRAGSGTVVRLEKSCEPGAGRDGGREATRARILKAAREIFFRDGFADTNLDEVAARAEVGKGTLYRHFENKAALYVAVLAVGGAIFDEELRAAIDEDASALDRMRSIGRFYRRYWTEHPDYFVIFSAVNHQEFIGQLPPALLAEVREIWEQPLRRLEQVIADGVRSGELRRCDPWIMANVVWRTGTGAVEALVTPRRARVIDCSAEALYESTLDLLLSGLDARGS
jgi:TetR/AcrR family transcriptional regulator